MTTVDDQPEDSAPGWDAITAAFAPLYPGQEPRHVGSVIPWMLNGKDPLDGISAWKRLDPVPHWHFVSYGLSELYDKASDDPQISGFGLELTFRLACDPGETDPPSWVFSLLQNLARYIFQSGNVFDDGHWMNLNGPIALGSDTLIGSLAFVFDPEVPPIDTPHGRVAFMQLVGLTVDEEAAGKRWNARKMLDTLLPHMPLWITDISRSSLLDRPAIRAALDAGSARDGSSTGMLFNDALDWSRQSRLLRPDITTITVGAGHVEAILALLRLRLPFGNELHLRGAEKRILVGPGGVNAVAAENEQLRLTLTNATLEALAATLHPRAGSYSVPGLDTVRWDVRQTLIKDADGKVVKTIG
ncbi:suppressor of fused domain protein [Sphingomonas sp. ERG5]|uniref:suppressor of fused domain protein n=1 Tax=Sphingomonas sp. ERG5 TaxID=1381597 RepID=UPI00054B9DF3|nr:suppressor of fused domain protein [Sphingomonas sp. ERG5]